MKSGKLSIVVALATIATLMLLSGEMFADGSNSESQSGAGAEQLTVDWEAARKHPQLDQSRLSEKQRKAARDSAVPVLLPDHDGLLHSAIITTGPSWFAASMAEGQATIAISGNSKVIRIPGIPEPPALGDPALKADAGEGRLEVNFKAFGVYYDISVECYDGAKDPHCADDRFLMQLVDSLKLVVMDK